MATLLLLTEIRLDRLMWLLSVLIFLRFYVTTCMASFVFAYETLRINGTCQVSYLPLQVYKKQFTQPDQLKKNWQNNFSLS